MYFVLLFLSLLAVVVRNRQTRTRLSNEVVTPFGADRTAGLREQHYNTTD